MTTATTAVGPRSKSCVHLVACTSYVYLSQLSAGEWGTGATSLYSNIVEERVSLETPPV